MFFGKIAQAPAKELPFIIRDDIPALLTDLGKAMDGYYTAFTKKNIPYAWKPKSVGQQLKLLANKLHTHFSAVYFKINKRYGQPFYTPPTSHSSHTLSDSAAELVPPQSIPPILHAIGYFFSDIGKALTNALKEQSNKLPADLSENSEIVVGVRASEKDVEAQFNVMVQIFYS